MPLRLEYRASTSVPVEVEGLLPAAVRDKSLAEIEKLPVFHGNQQQPLAELFAVSGSAADNGLEFIGDLSGVHWIGAGMTEGTIRVEASAGRHLGSRMLGGEIHVTGDAGDWVGGEMRGGLIHVHGNAGHHAGGAYPGSNRGMTRGEILVGGSAGDQIGARMRRGLLAVAGDCGQFAGFNLLAGNVLVFGRCGLRAGAGMRRGTVVLAGDHKVEMLPTFQRGSVQQPVYLRLLLKRLHEIHFAVDDALSRARYRMFHGDFNALGSGEILMRE